MSRLMLVVTVCFILPCPLAAQTTFADSSRLNDPAYVTTQIKEIADSTLFAAFDASLTDLAPLHYAAHAADWPSAYRLWGAHRARLHTPRYVTMTQQLFIDTEQLVAYERFRSVMESHPDERDTIISRAKMMLHNRIMVWGTNLVDFGSEVDFNREMGPSGKYGFHYWSWSKPLIEAFVLTGEKNYLNKFDALFARWYAQRNTIERTIPKFDVVYYELGLALRTRFFIEHDLLLRGDRPPEAHARMMKSVLGAARWLYELERCEGYRPGNWQMHGAYTLVQVGLTFPEFAEASAWRALGLRLLMRHLEEDFAEDGGHSEHSPRNYTMATYGLLRNLYFLLTVHGVDNDDAGRIRQRLGATIDWWITMLAPTGEIPAINDSHRGLFPGRILEDAAQFFHKPEVENVLQSLVYGKPAAPPLPPFTSRFMPGSGFTVMRSDWSRDALYMNINHGKLCPDHFHNDFFSFELYAFGRPWAIDAGIGMTYDDPLHVPWYQSSRAHNMVVVNETNADKEHFGGENCRWDSTATLQLFSGEHHGYQRFGTTCRRRILFVRPSYWVILDDVTSSRSGDTLSWYLHSPAHIAQEAGMWRAGTNPGLWIVPASPGVTTKLGEGMAASTVTLTPGATQVAPWIRFDQIVASPGRNDFAVLLSPTHSAASPPACTRPEPGHLRIRTDQFVDDIYFPEDGVPCDGISSDAQCVWVHSRNGRPMRAAMLQGTSLHLGKRDIFHLTVPGNAETAINQ